MRDLWRHAGILPVYADSGMIFVIAVLTIWLLLARFPATIAAILVGVWIMRVAYEQLERWTRPKA